MLDHPRMHFFEGDITINKEWVEYHVKKCDVILPLVAIATPSTYVTAPLRVVTQFFGHSREMFTSGDWIATRLNGIKYFEKPPLHTWMSALSFTLFGLGGRGPARW